MPRKSKDEELRDWLRNYQAYCFRIDCGQFQMNETVLIPLSTPDAAKLAENFARTLQPDAVSVTLVFYSGRVNV